MEPFNMAAETCNMELATKKVNRATEEMKRIVNKVKDTTEEAIKTVTGKDVKIDFINVGSSSSQQPTERLGFNREHSMSSLSSAATGMDSRYSMPVNSTNGNYPTNSNQYPYNGNVNNIKSAALAVTANSNSKIPPTPSTGTTAKNNPPNGIPVAQESNLYSATKIQQQEEEKQAQEKWEAELERAKRQKRWELEIERIRRERVEREQMAELERQKQAAAVQSSPVVGQGGCSCIIS